MNSLRWIAALATVSVSLPVFAAPTPVTTAYDFTTATSATVVPADGAAGSYAGFANGTYFGNSAVFAGTGGTAQSLTVSAYASTGTGNNLAPTGTGSGTNATNTNNGTIQNAVVTQYNTTNGGTGTYGNNGNSLGETSRNTVGNGEFTCTGNLNGTSTGNQTCSTTYKPTANHGVDNDGAYETLFFSFASAVTISNVTLGFPSVGSGNAGSSDLTLLYCTAKGVTDNACLGSSFGGKTYSQLVSSGDWAFSNLLNLSSTNDTGTTGLNAKSQYWMIGAFIADLPGQIAGDNTPDYVKIRAITTCTSAVCAVPEPGSVALFGIAGTALWIGRRRRTLRVA